MNPIINPLWFYLIDTVSVIGICIISISVMLMLAAFIILCASDDFYLEKKGKFWTRMLVISIFTFFIGVAIPQSKTSYKMMVAYYVTEDNVKAAGNVTKEAIDYIIESVERMRDLGLEDK